MASSDSEKRRLEEHLQQQASTAGTPEPLAPRQTTDSSLATTLDSASDISDVPPPAYGEEPSNIQHEKDGFGTNASVTSDGRVDISINQRNRRLSQLLAPTLRQLQFLAEEQDAPPYIPSSLGGSAEAGVAPPPPMNVVIQIVGSRGDVQPFIALAKVLQQDYGHRVRLATHPTFKDFVLENGIEFFSIGGDPRGLMAFMVKNPGLMPGFDSLRAGDVGKRRREIAECLQGCWRSCFEPGDGTGPPMKTDGDKNWSMSSSDDKGEAEKPFVADCIIANPPSFAHAHVAEKLGIPLHIFFTMPYSPTQAFPHPLANIQVSNADENLTNLLSYGLVDMLTWQGLGDIINPFRKRTLGLDEMSTMRAPGMLQRLRIPHTYAWSPALIPKPKDWGPSVSISGFFLLDQTRDYSPPPDLKAFLDAGPPPVYIGFGSIVLDDPDGMTALILEAVRKSSQRALVSKGWGGVSADQLAQPDNVFMLGNVPHDWLFQHVSCVVHHGGAGTTSAGITAGRPTQIVPFFGDQPFWGSMVAKAGAGPPPIPNKSLTADGLAEGIRKCLEPEMQERAQEMGAKIASEDGTRSGAQSFHQFLDVDRLRCSVAPARAAVWSVKQSDLRLSTLAACTLAQEGLLDFNDLELFRPRDYEVDEGPTDPMSGGTAAVIGTFNHLLLGMVDLPTQAVGMFKSRSGARATSEQGAGSAISEQSGTMSAAQSQSLSGPSGSDTSSMMKAAIGTGKGANRVVGGLLKAPMDFSVNMSRGFHNAPKIYGDDTVRKSEKVTGFKSGLKAAGKGLGLGLHDGITGLVTQPVKGTMKEGGLGFAKGFGKGIGGFFFKPGAALFAVPAYTMKGVYKEVQAQFGSSAQGYIVAARIAQGLHEGQRASEDERLDIVVQWRALQKKPDNEQQGLVRSSKGKAKQQKRRKGASDDPEAAMLAMGESSQPSTKH